LCSNLECVYGESTTDVLSLDRVEDPYSPKPKHKHDMMLKPIPRKPKSPHGGKTQPPRGNMPRLPHNTTPHRLPPRQPKGKIHTPIKRPVHTRPSPSLPRPVQDNLATTGYVEANAVRYLFYSYAAYCSSSALTSWNCPWCSGDDYTLTDVSTVSDDPSNSFGFVGYNSAHDEIVVSFRGTEPTSLTNWVEDLTIDKVDFPGVSGAHVHSGFYNNYLSVSQQTETAVDALLALYPSATVYFTGHSLGGAMATVATLDAAVSWNIAGDQLAHYSFGSPRVGDPTFATSFTTIVGSDNHYRVVNDDDLVPHVLPMIAGFHHIPTEVWLHDGTDTVCDSSGEDPQCSDSTLGLSVYDHVHYFGYFQYC